MESTLDKKNNYKFKKSIFSDIFILFVPFFSHFILFFIPKKLLHIVRNKIKKRIMPVG